MCKLVQHFQIWHSECADAVTTRGTQLCAATYGKKGIAYLNHSQNWPLLLNPQWGLLHGLAQCLL